MTSRESTKWFVGLYRTTPSHSNFEAGRMDGQRKRPQPGSSRAPIRATFYTKRSGIIRSSPKTRQVSWTCSSRYKHYKAYRLPSLGRGRTWITNSRLSKTTTTRGARIKGKRGRGRSKQATSRSIQSRHNRIEHCSFAQTASFPTRPSSIFCKSNRGREAET